MKSESSKNAKSFYCNKTGHVKAECNKRLRDLAEAEKTPMAASPHPHDTAAVVPLQCLLPGERHSSTVVIAMPCVSSETSCEFFFIEQAVESPGAGSFAPAEKQRVRPLLRFRQMKHTCGHVCRCKHFPIGFDQSATHDLTVAPERHTTATDDPVHEDAGKKPCFGLRDGRKFPSHESLGGCRVPWNQDKIEAVSPCCFDEHNRNGSQHSMHLHCYLGICALLHHLSVRNISMLHSEGSDVRIVAFRVDSSLWFIRKAPMCVSLRLGLLRVKVF